MVQLDIDNDVLRVELQICKIFDGYKGIGVIEGVGTGDKRGRMGTAYGGCELGKHGLCGGGFGADDKGEGWGGLRGEVGVEREIGGGRGGRGGKMGEKVAEGGGREGGGPRGAGCARAGEVVGGGVAQEERVGEGEREQGKEVGEVEQHCGGGGWVGRRSEEGLGWTATMMGRVFVLSGN